MDASEKAEPPVDRPTQMRWGCILVLLLLAVLVGGTIVAIFNSPRFSGATTTAGMRARGIFKAMMIYSLDHDGKFPTAEANSNEAFRQLFPDCMEGERGFFVPSSAWHDSALGKRPDGDIGVAPDYAKCLERGENHWAYVSGLDSSSAAELPVIADGFVENQPGRYTDSREKRGGVWKGTKASVVLADGSVKQVPLSAKTDFRVLRPDPATGKPVDIFTREGGLPEAARVLNPE